MEKFKVIVTARSFGNSSNEPFELLEKNNCCVIKLDNNDGKLLEKLEKEIEDADGIIASLEVYDEKLLSKAKKLKVISRYGVGYDKIDLNETRKRNIKVTITPGSNADSVADMAVALMLSTARNIPYMSSALASGEQKRPIGVEMWEKTLGIVGAGRIGKGVARRCKGFNMKVLCFDSYIDEEFKKEVGAAYVSFDELIKNSDFISIHSPLTEETKNMFGKNEFKLMKNNAIIINTARGGIIDEDALYEALAENEIRGCGLDTTVEEPPFGSKLLSLPNCIVTPHAGASTIEASEKMSIMSVNNLIEVLNTGTSKFLV